MTSSDIIINELISKVDAKLAQSIRDLFSSSSVEVSDAKIIDSIVCHLVGNDIRMYEIAPEEVTNISNRLSALIVEAKVI